MSDRTKWPAPSTVIACVALFAAVGGGGTFAAASIGGSPVAVADPHLTIAASAFVPVAESTHNSAGSSVCGTFVPSEQGAENTGDLNARKGSFLSPVELPDGVTASDLTVFANDNDGDENVHVFLVRKLLKDGLSPQFNGYRVMAKTASNGAVLNTMRAFTDPTVNVPTIDNGHFEYYVEMVNCATTEPFAVRIGY